MRAGALLGGLLLLSACSTTLSADHYSQSCVKEDSECTVVLVGDMCECTCVFAAISAREQANYDRDRAAISCTNGKICGPCPGAEARCSAGRCVIK